MKIRRLKQSDAKEASRLFMETFEQIKRHYTAEELNEGRGRYSVKGLRELMAKGKYLFRVAEDNGKLAGIVECDFPVSGLCWIDWIIVRKSYQRKGIGSVLVRSLERDTQGKWNRIMCRTRLNNLPPSSLFKKLGYRKVSTLRRRIKKRTVYAWEKLLK
jgi:ribosomal protein S18 acetylase RimI-like enzyme